MHLVIVRNICAIVNIGGIGNLWHTILRLFWPHQCQAQATCLNCLHLLDVYHLYALTLYDLYFCMTRSNGVTIFKYSYICLQIKTTTLFLANIFIDILWNPDCRTGEIMRYVDISFTIKLKTKIILIKGYHCKTFPFYYHYLIDVMN